MKAHLPFPERDDALERRVVIADEPPLERLEIEFGFRVKG
jgi:hypothetical protein